MEEFNIEVDLLRSLENPVIIPLYGVVLNLPKVGVLSPLCAQGSLYEKLHIEKAKISFK